MMAEDLEAVHEERVAISARLQLDHVGTTRVYKRDCALRAHSAALAEQVYCERFGVIFGQSLAAAEAGPEDMTKHSQLGQGSGGGLV